MADRDIARQQALTGTAETAPPATILSSGPLTVEIAGGRVGRVWCDGTEVLRGVDYPIRDADWATAPRHVRDEEVGTGTYACRVDAGGFEGVFRVAMEEAGRVTFTLDLVAGTDVVVNRAAFVLLHPLKGVVGCPLRVRHSDGTTEETAFPTAVSPGQPVFDIAGLSHEVDGVRVDIAFEGETFEMEDQRNWTDASYKTYGRPLSAPRPFRVARGERVRQRVTLSVSPAGEGPRPAADPVPATGRLPAVELAVEPGIRAPSSAALGHLRRLGPVGVRLRLTAGDPVPAAAALPDGPVTLEIVIPEGAAPDAALRGVADAARSLPVTRVVALPAAYLASHQPDGPWPGGPTPDDAAEAARAAFPDAAIGRGMLTNFTEFNRCPPRGAMDFATFGTTAIVHDASDRAVLDTLEALPHVLASARGLVGDAPLRLGLMSVGMRSNPYGAAVAPNPAGVRTEMAMDDPRQRGLFAAAFAVGLAAALAEAGVESFAPAMPDGPLGLGEGEAVHPLFHVVRALAHLAGSPVRIAPQSSASPLILSTERTGLSGVAANLGDGEVRLERAARVLDAAAVPDARDPDWLDVAPLRTGPVTLSPLELAFLYDGADA